LIAQQYQRVGVKRRKEPGIPAAKQGISTSKKEFVRTDIGARCEARGGSPVFSIWSMISLFLKTVKYDSIRPEGNQGLPGLLRGRRVEDLPFAEGRGSDPATMDNTANFAQTEVLADPLQQ
jgi:hypothetical protein